MKRPLFSIVTTTYNRLASGFLEQNINSVRDSGTEASILYEHIIIDDGSTDETREFLEDLCLKDSHIKYIYQKNSGPAIAVQNGLKQVVGEYVIILDDDDFLTKDSLVKRAEYIKNNPTVDFLYGKADWVDEFGLPMTPLFQSVDVTEYLYEEMLVGNCINAGTPSVKSDIIKSIIWPDWVNRSQDYFLWLEILRPKNNAIIGFLDTEIVNYRYHNKNYTAAIDDDLKKSAKAELNNRIRDLHPLHLVYLAKRARTWIDEAHKTNEYRLVQQQDALQRIDEIQRALDSFAHSRVVRATVKGRNVIRGQVFDRVSRIKRRISERIIEQSKLTTSNLSTGEFIEGNEPWGESLPLLTVVTPFYNRSDTMPDTIRSVLSQTYQNFEYIIVDDGSTDDDAKDYLAKIHHEKIKIIHQKNQGVAMARNTGVKNAKGKYIVCLDSDDMLDPTYLEKALIVLESQPDVAILTCDMQMFGKKIEAFIYQSVDPLDLIDDNFVITAAMYRKQVWDTVGGYKKDIGYEDWEFWVSAAENGYKFAHIPEKLFLYRTAEVSRYVDDLSNHKTHSLHIQNLHHSYRKKVLEHRRVSPYQRYIKPTEAFNNVLIQPKVTNASNSNKRVLVAIPWMTFGGAETLILNYCKQVSKSIDISFVTALPSENEWEYKFKKLSDKIYHMDRLFTDENYQLSFISYLINAHKIDTLHIVHSGYAFKMLEELKRRHPKLEVIVTLFNDRAEYFEQSIKVSNNIDKFSTDNTLVAEHFRKKLPSTADVRVIPNGVDSAVAFNLDMYDRKKNREDLNIKDGELAVFFVGRLSEEKNPDVFIEAAEFCLRKEESLKFFIVGDGPLRREVEEKIEATGRKEIIYLGYKSDVAPYLSAADVFVLPSSIEGFPLSILEAMSMSVAPIASRVGAVPDVIKDGNNGYIVEPGSSKQIAESVLELRGDKRLLENVKKEARQSVLGNYSNDSLGKNYLKLYGEDL